MSTTPRGSYAKSWCFTLNNYSEAEYRSIIEWGASPGCEYLVVGRETGGSGTPHLQGYVVLAVRSRLPALKKIAARAHWAVARGSAADNRVYCSKEGSFQECGTLPLVGQGKRSDIDDFKSWVLAYHGEHGVRPPESAIAVEYSSLWLRYQQRLLSLCEHLLPPPSLIPPGATLKPWQSDLMQALEEPCADDRSVLFYVDSEGGKGKSWFCRYVLTTLGKKVQLLSPAKRDDLGHAINVECSIFLFNVARGQMEFLRYEVLESLKDRTIFSPKYQSQMKILSSCPHVVVFCNEEPDMTKMTEDRYLIERL